MTASKFMSWKAPKKHLFMSLHAETPGRSSQGQNAARSTALS
jgi:hypothetical protein